MAFRAAPSSLPQRNEWSFPPSQAWAQGTTTTPSVWNSAVAISVSPEEQKKRFKEHSRDKMTTSPAWWFTGVITDGPNGNNLVEWDLSVHLFLAHSVHDVVIRRVFIWRTLNWRQQSYDLSFGIDRYVLLIVGGRRISRKRLIRSRRRQAGLISANEFRWEASE